jgi:hypothetical protein
VLGDGAHGLQSRMNAITARGRPGSLPLAVARHLAGLVAAVALVYAAGVTSPVAQQPMLWVAAAALAGAIAGLLDRGWLGLLFVEIGVLLGIAAPVLLSARDTHEAAAALAAAAPLYLAVLLGGAAAYLIVRLVRRQLS